MIRRILRYRSNTRIPSRGNGHYGRLEVMAWCEANDIACVFGLPKDKTLHADPVIVYAADACATAEALQKLVEMFCYVETRYAARS